LDPEHRGFSVLALPLGGVFILPGWPSYLPGLVACRIGSAATFSRPLEMPPYRPAGWFQDC
jgi:hypothetical protein